jgi:hypothetical protein
LDPLSALDDIRNPEEEGGQDGRVDREEDSLDWQDVNLGAEESESPSRGGEGEDAVSEFQNCFRIHNLLAFSDNRSDTLRRESQVHRQIRGGEGGSPFVACEF